MHVCVVVFQADKRAADADEALREVGKTSKRAKDVDAEIKNMLKKIKGKEKLTMSSVTQ